MKRSRLSNPLLVLAISTVLIASAGRTLMARENNPSSGSGVTFAATAVDSGRLMIKRSPVLGDNVAITVTIDGKPAGTVRRGSSYERSLAPGRHVLTVTPNRLRGPWSTTLEVRSGQTYSYVASFQVNKLVLTPATSAR